MATIFLLTIAEAEGNNQEDVLLSGSVFQTLAGAQRSAQEFADSQSELSCGDPEPLSWSQSDTETWASQGSDDWCVYMVREVVLGH